VSIEGIQTTEEVFYPSTEEDPMAENEAHLMAMVLLIVILREYFRTRSDVYVVGDMFWYYEEGDNTKRRAPDLMVVKGVDPGPSRGRRNFQDWTEHSRPCFILEIASESTWQDDLNDKKTLYQRLGVQEYFLFDPLGEFLDAPLIGFRMMPIEDTDGNLVQEYETLKSMHDGAVSSRELGLILRPVQDRLVLLDARTRVPLPEPAELADRVRELLVEMTHLREVDEQRLQQIELERQRADSERQRADSERERADAERQRADAERQRADQFLAELEALRRRLPPTDC